MKKIYYFILLVFISLSSSLYSQVEFSGGTNTSSNLPINAYYGYSVSQSIYLSSEISVGGTITGLKFDFAGSTLSNSNGWKVYIGHTSKSSFANSTDWIPYSNLNNVYNGTITSNSGWNEIIFQTPFVYNGTDNLVISVIDTLSGYNGSSDDFRAYSAGTNRSLLHYTDNAPIDVNSLPTTNTLSSYLPNIIFNGLTITCPKPTSLTSSSIQSTSASLAWTDNASASAWEVEYAASPYTFTGVANKTGITTNPYILTGLAQGTSYKYKVRAVCSASDKSQWSSISSLFTTTITCPKPTTLTVSNLGDQSADLGWTEAGTASQWQIENIPLSSTFTTVPNYTNIAFNPKNISGLTQNTSYQYKVRAVCGVGDTSQWSSSLSYKTFCSIVVPDYKQTFNTVAPDCWSEFGNGYLSTGPSQSSVGSGDWASTTTFGNNAKINLFSNADREWLISPAFDLSAGGYEIKLDVAVTNYNSTAIDSMGIDDSVALVYSLDGMNWNIIKLWTKTDNLSNTLSTFQAPLSINSMAIFGIYATDGSIDNSEDYDFHIDNFVVRKIPTCLEPSMLTADSIKWNSARLSWTDTASMWDIEYGTSGYTPTGTPTVSGITSKPYTLTGLSQNTTYNYYVRSDCNSNGKSPWSGPYSFKTPYSCPAPTLLNTSVIADTTVILNWTDNANASAWELEKSSSSSFTGVATNTGITTNPYNFNGLNPNSKYYVKIRAVCGPNDTSFWSSYKYFKTICGNYYPSYFNGMNISTITDSCWSKATGLLSDSTSFTSSSSSNWFRGNFMNTSAEGYSYKIEVYGTKSDWLISPSFDLTNTVNYALTYDYAITNYYNTNTDIMANNDTIAVLISTDNGITWSKANKLKQYTKSDNISNTRNNALIDLTGYTGVVKFAFYAQRTPSGTADDYYFYIDNFNIDTLPNCFAPSYSFNNLTDSSVDVILVDTNNSLWVVEYGNSGFTVGQGTIDTITDTMYAISGLSALSTYDIYVYSICDTNTGLKSTKSKKTFTTLCGSYLPTFIEGFATTTLADCWEEARTTKFVYNGDIKNDSMQKVDNNWYITNASIFNSNALRLNMYYYNRPGEWIISPSIDLGNSSQKYQLDFDAAFLDYGNTNPIELINGDDTMAVLISTDNGITWSSSGILALYDSINPPPTVGKFVYDLSSYTGKVKFAFYGKAKNVYGADYDWWVDNFAVRPKLNDELELVDILSSDKSCGSANTKFSVVVKNNGFNNESGNIINYIINGDTSSVSINISAHTVDTFDLVTLNTRKGQNFDIKAIVNLTLDALKSNDTLSKLIVLDTIPSTPMINDILTCEDHNFNITNPNSTYTTSYYNDTNLLLYSGSTYYTILNSAGNFSYLANQYTSVSDSIEVTTVPTNGFLSNNYGVIYESNNNFKLKSVRVYPNGTGTITLRLLGDNVDKILGTYNVTDGGTPYSPFVVNINQDVPNGKNRIVLSSYSGISNLGRHFGSSSNYPIMSQSGGTKLLGGSTSLTSSPSTSFYYLYDWQIDVNGCASDYDTINVSVVATTYNATKDTICDNEYSMMNNVSYNLAGMYYDTISNMMNCDSVLSLNLMVYPTYNHSFYTQICEGDSVMVGNTWYSNTGIVTKLLTSNKACDSIVAVHISKYAPAMSSMTHKICAGDSVFVNGMWYFSEQTVTQLLNNASANGCDSTINHIIKEKSINPPLNLGDDKELCTEGGFTLFVSNQYDSILWMNGSTNNSISSYGNVDGEGVHMYSVEVYQASVGCYASDTMYVTYEICNVGIDELNTNLNVDLYPNPANEYVKIDVKSELNSSITMQITSVDGKIIFLKDNCNLNEIVDLSNFVSGVYTIKINVDNTFVMKRLVIRK